MKNEEKKERIRKVYAARGERSQKMMTFRVDNDLLVWLESKTNKGRYINDLIRRDQENSQ